MTKSVKSTPLSSTSTSSQPKSDTNAIVGGVVGGIACVPVGCSIFWLTWRERQQRRIGQGEDGRNFNKSQQTQEKPFLAEFLDSSHNEADEGKLLPKESDARSLYEFRDGAVHLDRGELGDGSL